MTQINPANLRHAELALNMAVAKISPNEKTITRISKLVDNAAASLGTETLAGVKDARIAVERLGDSARALAEKRLKSTQARDHLGQLFSEHGDTLSGGGVFDFGLMDDAAAEQTPAFTSAINEWSRTMTSLGEQEAVWAKDAAKAKERIEDVRTIVMRANEELSAGREVNLGRYAFEYLLDDLERLADGGPENLPGIIRRLNWADSAVTADFRNGVQAIRGHVAGLQESTRALRKSNASLEAFIAKARDELGQIEASLRHATTAKNDARAALNGSSRLSRRKLTREFQDAEQRVARLEAEALDARDRVNIVTSWNGRADGFKKLLESMREVSNLAFEGPNATGSFITAIAKRGRSTVAASAIDEVRAERIATERGTWIRTGSAAQKFSEMRRSADDSGVIREWQEFLDSLDEDTVDLIRRIDENLPDPVMYLSAVENSLRNAGTGVYERWTAAIEAGVRGNLSYEASAEKLIRLALGTGA